MGWQKEFTLSKRSKGCHLVTDEVMSHIRPGLESVQASRCLPFGTLILRVLIFHEDRHAFPLHVRAINVSSKLTK